MQNNAKMFVTSWTKTLSSVEVSPETSNQHEFNGVQGLKDMFGVARFSRDAIFFVEGENEQHMSIVTWYDAREAHPSRSEYRLYFKENAVMRSAVAGDNIVIGFNTRNELCCMLVKQEKTAGMRIALRWQKI